MKDVHIFMCIVITNKNCHSSGVVESILNPVVTIWCDFTADFIIDPTRGDIEIFLPAKELLIFQHRVLSGHFANLWKTMLLR